MSNKAQTEGNIKKGSGRTFAFAACFLVIAVLLGVVIYLMLNKDSGSDKTKKRNIVVNSDNIESVISDLAKKDRVPTGRYAVKMNSNWKFADGAAVSENAYVENAKSNTNDVYFDIIRSDTGETILSSPIIPVGAHLKNITLDKVLEAGSYKCVMKYHLCDSEGNSLSTVSVNMTIVVEQ